MNLKLQAVNPPGFFRLIHLQGPHLRAKPREHREFFSVCVQRVFQLAKVVQVGPMQILIQKLLAIVLAMDIQQFRADFPELGDRNGSAIDPADIFSIGENLPLYVQFSIFIRRNPALRKAGKVRTHAGKNRTDERFGSAGADQFPGCAPAQDCPHRVNDDGLSCAGFTGQCIEAGAKLNVCLFNDSNIFNMKQFQHRLTP